jgi:hypothetical protein
MKWLKLFESWKGMFQPNNIVRELEDICLELNDIDINTEFSWFPSLVILGTKSGGYISVGMEKHLDDSNDYIDQMNWNEISEVVDKIIDFIEGKGWYLSSISIDGDTLRQAQANHFIKSPSAYEFGGITFNFKEP